ncbi:AAA family ATPase [Thomasclavelia spiroformis]|uniref:AAA family ATPase n=1 Tax=Thomasclavelia spiroformis TaxID=29348 RepID=UPI0026776475|nr:AAA family ATPase [Thomasclavelia spiroformis]
MSNIVYVTVGHTASGKSTLSRMLSVQYNVQYISEGAIKRALVKSYKSEDSLDESLRNQGYQLAINELSSTLKNHTTAILDASFHKRFRRKWLYDMLETIPDTYVVWLYCYCPCTDIIRKRIKMRNDNKNKYADIQADIFDIYEHIQRTFDIPTINEFPKEIPTAIIKIDTYNNVVEDMSYNTTFNIDIIKNLMRDFFPNYFLSMKHRV